MRKRPKHSFNFYFILFTSLTICVALALATLFSELTNLAVNAKNEMLIIIMVLGYSLIIGSVLANFVGKVLIAPVKRLQKKMNRVAMGDFTTEELGLSRIDEVNDLNHSFNLMMQQLRSTEVIQSDFVANVSHEFKTPLSVIEGYATLLQDDNLTGEERKKYAEAILSSSRRVNQLIANVLLLSRLDNQAIDANKTRFSLDEQICQSVVAQEPRWAEKNIDFDVETDSVTYLGNCGVMQHVWDNLISNAVKFSPKGGVVKIRLKNLGDQIVFTIDDEGDGIPEDKMQYVFNKFYQADTSHKGEGNGLGLALVKKILDVVGGDVFVENLPEKGCRFTVKINV